MDWSTPTFRHPVLSHRGEVRLDVQPLVRLQLELLRQLFFCHLIYEVDGTSTCSPVGLPPVETTRPHIQLLMVTYAFRLRALSISLSDSRLAIASLLSWNRLPRATPNSSLAIPFLI